MFLIVVFLRHVYLPMRLSPITLPAHITYGKFNPASRYSGRRGPFLFQRKTWSHLRIQNLVPLGCCAITLLINFELSTTATQLAFRIVMCSFPATFHSFRCPRQSFVLVSYVLPTRKFESIIASQQQVPLWRQLRLP